MRCRASRGSGLVVSVIVLAALGAMSIGSVAVLRTLRRESLYQKRILQAEALAELGIQDALRKLADDPTWIDGFAQKPMEDGYYDVSVSTGASTTVTSTGYAGAMHLLGRPFRTV